MVPAALAVCADNVNLLTTGPPDRLGESLRPPGAIRQCLLLAGAFLLAFAGLCAPARSEASEPKRVLFLHSFGQDSAPYNATVAAIRAQLMKDSPEPLAIYDATLDAGQRKGSDDLRPFVDFLRHRFAALTPQVVVTIGPPAATFYLNNRDKLFPATPVVLATIDQRLVPRELLRAGDAVVASHHNPPVLVENILRVLPETQRIVVVIGSSPLERYWLSEFRREFARFTDKVSFEWLNELSFGQMRARVAALPPRSAVLYAILFTDAAGVPHESESALTGLIEVSTAPVFSFYESEFGYGVVGGPYQSQQRRGAVTAAAVLRVLRGETRAAPEIQLVEYDAPIYDWRALKRWGIDPRRLPVGSEIRFRPPSLWNEHRALIIVAISIVLLQATLLMGFVWQRIRRRRAEKEALTLSGRLITAHEDERRWLARELHDDFTQRLAGLAIDAAKLPGGDTSGEASDRSVYSRLVQMSDDIHDLSYRLHPSMLDDLGLVEALKAECDRVARTDAVHVEVEADTLPQNLPKDAALCIYRVAQEALRNIGRHARASVVQLSLALTDGGLSLAVSDNGSGFAPDLISSRPHLGHASMRERIRLLSGELDIYSIPGRGTTIRAWVPIPRVPA
jgi:signal transduction histidine kinase